MSRFFINKSLKAAWNFLEILHTVHYPGEFFFISPGIIPKQTWRKVKL